MTDTCDECGAELGLDSGPPGGWQVEDGRTLCQSCCGADLRARLKAEKLIEDDEPFEWFEIMAYTILASTLVLGLGRAGYLLLWS